jgi:hypothetical protein
MPGKPDPAHVVAAKRDALRAALTAAAGNVSAAADALAVDYATVQRQIARYGLRAWLDEAYPRGSGARGRWPAAPSVSTKKARRGGKR